MPGRVFLAFLTLLLGACGGSATPTSEGTGTTAATTGTTTSDGLDLAVGACLIEEIVEYQGEDRPALTRNVGCDEPHAAEVVAMVEGSSFLAARTACKDFAADEYGAVPQEMFYVFGPSERGGTSYACLYNSAGAAGPISGS